MNKIILVILAVVVIAAFGIYYFSTATNTIEVQDDSPIINDNMLTMDQETREDFEQQTNEASNNIITMDDQMPTATLLAEGQFKPRAHTVKGKALLIQEDNQKILRFEDFETINGPKLHIYLSTGLGNDDFIDLGEIKATKGNVNYDIPEGIDTEKYNKVLVWCKPFKVLFSYAEL